jgi:5-methylcytosine-specific restriction protein A
VTNAVAICPNCHRGLHYAQNAKGMVESIYAKVKRKRPAKSPSELQH